MKTVEYLGAVIGNGMVSMSEARVQHLRSLPVPGDVHELRRALGSFAFVQRWIPGVAETARPLYDALDKDGRQKLHWTDKMKSAFNKLKQQVSDAVALYLPDFTKPFTLVTDASDVGTGAMLANRDGQHLKPLGFFHHALSQHEKRVGPNGDLVCSVQAQTLDLESDLTTTIFSPEQLLAEQRMDQQVSPVRAALISGERLSNSRRLQPVPATTASGGQHSGDRGQACPHTLDQYIRRTRGECGYWVQPVRATIRPPSSSTGVGDQHRGGAGSSAVTNRRGG
ncbi:uncharacterized protein LOC122367597 isoform X4 [Amphibalanus amphitrite]|uniref:uncharacterized protein LOC122367597 isoform X4 n=1 Tax=Amphibalanus amphitrite TaxID=1232801 RepID=UPI001C92AF81|nr:uncharacterized protein LOC122367597 isoform X4 [Amphibalanus amphitrite]